MPTVGGSYGLADIRANAHFVKSDKGRHFDLRVWEYREMRFAASVCLTGFPATDATLLTAASISVPVSFRLGIFSMSLLVVSAGSIGPSAPDTISSRVS